MGGSWKWIVAALALTLVGGASLGVVADRVMMRDGNYYLMQVDAQDRIHEVKVATGRRQDEALEIVGAVEGTARFVKSGGAFLTEGDLVQVAPGGAPLP